MQVKALPITSRCLGVSASAGGIASHLPLPTKLTTRVLPAMHALPERFLETYAERVHTAMQDAMIYDDWRPKTLLG